MRRVQLSAELIERIAADVRLGNFVEPSARRHGVRHSTLYLWLARGRDLLRYVERSDEEHTDAPTKWTVRDRFCVDLVDAVEKAEADAEVRVVSIVHGAIPANWTAAFRWLESHAPSRWLRVDRRDGAGNTGGPIEVESPAERIRVRADRVAARLLELPQGSTSGHIDAAVAALWERAIAQRRSGSTREAIRHP